MPIYGLASGCLMTTFFSGFLNNVLPILGKNIVLNLDLDQF
jgi:hypothetical protein